MLRLSEEIGQPIVAADGSPAGRVVDLVASLRGGRPRVCAVITKLGKGTLGQIGWASIRSYEHEVVELGPGAVVAPLDGVPLGVLPLGGAPDDSVVGREPRAVSSGEEHGEHVQRHEIRLVRDVLDTQVVDTSGHRLGRVADVQLVRHAEPTKKPDADGVTGGTGVAGEPGVAGELEVIGVELGISGVVRRLGLRRVADRIAEDTVAWEDVHLVSRHGNLVQLATSGSAVHRLESHDLAQLLARLPTTAAADVVVTLPTSRSADAIAASHEEVGHRIVSALEPDAREELLAALPPEKARLIRDTIARAAGRRRLLRHGGWRRPPDPSRGGQKKHG